ncbi:MAG: 6-phosphogluconolactonase [Clostridia bacterium]|nr:6-phosphogluconolactonase [Clostridia bacterium]
MLKHIKKDKLDIEIYGTRAEMGAAAGKAAADRIRALLREKDEVNVIFAAAPSQNETLAALCAAPDVDWTRVNAFHMDEYVGLTPDAPQNFGSFLRNAIFSKLPFKSVRYIYAEGESEDETIARYTALLEAHPVDVVCLGIGENAHIAFNDPWVADFDDPVLVKRVPLDEVCRQQQVNDGCFARLDDVPRYALTLTVPALTRAGWLFCTVPAPTKADAVYAVVNADVGPDVPATSMRLHNHAVMYCDRDSGARVL